MNDEFKKQLYRLMDGFLVEGDEPRSIDRLNQDRHLFVDNLAEIIESKKAEWQKEARERGLVDGYHVGCSEPYGEFDLGEIEEYLKSAKEEK